MRQTGWNISILAGGPYPNNGGMITTYLFVRLFTVVCIFMTDLQSRSHTGKTKDGDLFEKFLGKKEYDDNLLVPFERFLHACFCEHNFLNAVTTT